MAPPCKKQKLQKMSPFDTMMVTDMRDSGQTSSILGTGKTAPVTSTSRKRRHNGEMVEEEHRNNCDLSMAPPCKKQKLQKMSPFDTMMVTDMRDSGQTSSILGTGKTAPVTSTSRKRRHNGEMVEEEHRNNCDLSMAPPCKKQKLQKMSPFDTMMVTDMRDSGQTSSILGTGKTAPVTSTSRKRRHNGEMVEEEHRNNCDLSMAPPCKKQKLQKMSPFDTMMVTDMRDSGQTSSILGTGKTAPVTSTSRKRRHNGEMVEEEHRNNCDLSMAPPCKKQKLQKMSPFDTMMVTDMRDSGQTSSILGTGKTAPVTSTSRKRRHNGEMVEEEHRNNCDLSMAPPCKKQKLQKMSPFDTMMVTDMRDSGQTSSILGTGKTAPVTSTSRKRRHNGEMVEEEHRNNCDLSMAPPCKKQKLQKMSPFDTMMVTDMRDSGQTSSILGTGKTAPVTSTSRKRRHNGEMVEEEHRNNCDLSMAPPCKKQKLQKMSPFDTMMVTDMRDSGQTSSILGTGKTAPVTSTSRKRRHNGEMVEEEHRNNCDLSMAPPCKKQKLQKMSPFDTMMVTDMRDSGQTSSILGTGKTAPVTSTSRKRRHNGEMVEEEHRNNCDLSMAPPCKKQKLQKMSPFDTMMVTDMRDSGQTSSILGTGKTAPVTSTSRKRRHNGEMVEEEHRNNCDLSMAPPCKKQKLQKMSPFDTMMVTDMRDSGQTSSILGTGKTAPVTSTSRKRRHNGEMVEEEHRNNCDLSMAPPCKKQKLQKMSPFDTMMVTDMRDSGQTSSILGTGKTAPVSSRSRKRRNNGEMVEEEHRNNCDLSMASPCKKQQLQKMSPFDTMMVTDLRDSGQTSSILGTGKTAPVTSRSRKRRHNGEMVEDEHRNNCDLSMAPSCKKQQLQKMSPFDTMMVTDMRDSGQTSSILGTGKTAPVTSRRRKRRHNGEMVEEEHRNNCDLSMAPPCKKQKLQKMSPFDTMMVTDMRDSGQTSSILGTGKTAPVISRSRKRRHNGEMVEDEHRNNCDLSMAPSCKKQQLQKMSPFDTMMVTDMRDSGQTSSILGTGKTA
ncbi:mucin-4 [Amia ocellicauda]|uniref:mucin-4 n=1 Tax=Amia ocellicauda TaxID=2972642 RepID=UPI003464E4F5